MCSIKEAWLDVVSGIPDMENSISVGDFVSVHPMNLSWDAKVNFYEVYSCDGSVVKIIFNEKVYTKTYAIGQVTSLQEYKKINPLVKDSLVS